MNRQQFIDSVCKSLKLADLTPDSNGVYAIVFDGSLEIEILPMSETRLLLRSRLAPLPDDPNEHEQFLKGLLQRNLANQHSQRGSVTLDREARCLWLYRLVDATPLDARAASELMEDFVNLADWWSQEESAAPQPGLSFPMLRP